MKLFLRITFVCLLPLMARAAGPYVVDDADIVDKGTLQNENWISRTNKHETVLVTNGAYQIFDKAEFTLEYDHDAQPGEHHDVLSPQLKYQFYEGNGIKTSAVLGVQYDNDGERFATVYGYVPISFKPVEKLDVNVNLGLQRQPEGAQDFVTWGAGTEYHFTDSWSFVDELFGRDTDRPGFQFGPHYVISKQFELDLVYGHNVFDDSENIVTAGLTVNW